MRLLVIEDDAILRESLAAKLAESGFAVEQAAAEGGERNAHYGRDQHRWQVYTTYGNFMGYGQHYRVSACIRRSAPGTRVFSRP